MFSADLSHTLTIPHIIEFLTAHSYTGMQSSEKVTVRRTTSRSRAVNVVTLLRDPPATGHVDYVGFEIRNEFVVVYRPDWNGAYRNPPFVEKLDRAPDGQPSKSSATPL